MSNINSIIKKIHQAFPDARVALEYNSPLQLLVAVILSAQCTDKRVNIVTKTLFAKYHSVKDYANADISDLEQVVRSTGFFRAKSKNIQNSARLIISKFNGVVPRTMKEILELPGVARKTANIVLGNAYDIVEGIAVDTHVIRITKLLGFTKHTDPVKIEQDLMKIVPKNEWLIFPVLIQTLGRQVCIARKPNHSACPLKQLCPSSKL